MGMASLGLFCSDKALGMATLGVICGARPPLFNSAIRRGRKMLIAAGQMMNP